MKKKAIKIALYLPNLESGGAEKIIITLANELALRNYNVILILGRAEGEFSDSINPRVMVKVLGFTSIISSIFKLFGIIKKESPDILCVTKTHINTVVSLFSLFLKDTKVVLREANTPSVEYSHSGWYVKMIMNLGKFTYKFAHKYIAVSKGVAEDMSAFYGLSKSNITTIYNPVISENFFDLSQETSSHHFFEERKKNPSIYIFVAVGRLMPQKDYPTMIKSFSSAYKNNKNIRLLILGRVEQNNSHYSIVMKLIEKNNLDAVIDFIGFVKNPLKFLSKADCFVQTSLYEGLPGTIVQALALKKNIIATNCKSGPYEVLAGGTFGFLFEVGDIETLTSGMILYSQGKCNAVANKGYLDQFTCESSVQEYINLFESLV